MTEENVYLLPLISRPCFTGAFIPSTYLPVGAKAGVDQTQEEVEKTGEAAIATRAEIEDQAVNQSVTEQDSLQSSDASSSTTSSSNTDEDVDGSNASIDPGVGASSSAPNDVKKGVSQGPGENQTQPNHIASVEQTQILQGRIKNVPIMRHFGPDLLQQYYLAGLVEGQSIPAKPFPHASVEFASESRRHYMAKAARQLASSQPPLYTARPLSKEHPDLARRKNKHLGIVNTLLHRFLAEGDYARANQAWALLIRAIPHGTDVRQLGRWGIGAELLLHQTAAEGKSNSDQGDLGMSERHEAATSTRQTSNSSPSLDSSPLPSSPSSSSSSPSTKTSSADLATEDELNFAFTDSSDGVTPAIVAEASHSTSAEESDTPAVRVVKAASEESSSSRRRVPTISDSASISNSVTHKEGSHESSSPTTFDSSSRSPVTNSKRHVASAPEWLPNINFVNAKRYYESMITKYEPRERNISAAQRASMPNFYPALFSVWIYQVVQQSKMALWRFEQEQASPMEHEDDLFVSADHQSPQGKRAVVEEIIKKKELQGAKDIAQRLDEVLEKPLYDSNLELLRLRGMTGQWIMDLLRPDEGVVAQTANHGDDADADMGGNDNDDDDDGYFAAFSKARRAYARARACEEGEDHDSIIGH